jgi:putative nucleotidyltransferase with HDIG domain
MPGDLVPITFAVSRTERLLVAAQVCLLGISAAGGVMLSEESDWHPATLLLLLLGVAIVSDAFKLRTERITISAAFLSLVLAMTLLGPAPAALLGVVSKGTSDVLRRIPLRHALVNASTYAFFPLVGGAVFELVGGPGLLNASAATYILAVFALFLATNVLNYLLIAIDVAVVDGMPVLKGLRTVYLPLLPIEFATGLLTAGVAFAYQGGDNLAVIGLVAIVGLVFQYLLRTALNSIEHKSQLEGRTRELAALQVGLLGTVLQTLSLRDKMTARHSAAVARYSREIARELGLSDRDQDVVHTAALLHDIGKFIFPDSILFADTKLTNEQFEIVRRHPEQGARLVARIEGYGPVAEIILAHHERIDGRGYPNGLIGEQIPLAARIISVADTYDVMTSRDSYREPVSSREAIEELRRVSDAQLDARVVETFIALLEQRSVTFRHADDADFERELNLERRVRDYAAPRAAAA